MFSRKALYGDIYIFKTGLTRHKSRPLPIPLVNEIQILSKFRSRKLISVGETNPSKLVTDEKLLNLIWKHSAQSKNDAAQKKNEKKES